MTEQTRSLNPDTVKKLLEQGNEELVVKSLEKKFAGSVLLGNTTKQGNLPEAGIFDTVFYHVLEKGDSVMNTRIIILLLHMGRIEFVLEYVSNFVAHQRNEREQGKEEKNLPEDLMEMIYKFCIDHKLVEEYAQFYEYTDIVPHGTLIAPMFEHLFEKYIPKKNKLSSFERDVLGQYGKLLPYTFDKLQAFKSYIKEFSDVIPSWVLHTALDISETLQDDEVRDLILLALVSSTNKKVDHCEPIQEALECGDFNRAAMMLLGYFGDDQKQVFEKAYRTFFEHMELFDLCQVFRDRCVLPSKNLVREMTGRIMLEYNDQRNRSLAEKSITKDVVQAIYTMLVAHHLHEDLIDAHKSVGVMPDKPIVIALASSLEEDEIKVGDATQMNVAALCFNLLLHYQDIDAFAALCRHSDIRPSDEILLKALNLAKKAHSAHEQLISELLVG